MQIRRFSRVDFRTIPAPKGAQARDVRILSHPTMEEEAQLRTAQSNKNDQPYFGGSPRPNFGAIGPDTTPGAAEAPKASTAGAEIPRNIYAPVMAPHIDTVQTGPTPPAQAPNNQGNADQSRGSLPSLDAVGTDPGDMVRWASVQSTTSMDFGSNPLASPTAASADANPHGVGKLL